MMISFNLLLVFPSLFEVRSLKLKLNTMPTNASQTYQRILDSLSGHSTDEAFNENANAVKSMTDLHTILQDSHGSLKDDNYSFSLMNEDVSQLPLEKVKLLASSVLQNKINRGLDRLKKDSDSKKFSLAESRVKDSTSQRHGHEPDDYEVEIMKSDFEDAAKVASEKLGQNMTGKEYFEAVQAFTKPKLSLKERFMQPRILAMGGGGCISVLTQMGYKQTYEGIVGTKGSTMRAMTGSSGGAWAIGLDQAIAKAGTGVGDCSPFQLSGDTTEERKKSLLKCIGCVDKTYAECNVGSDLPTIKRVFGPMSSCITKGTNKNSDIKKYLHTFSQMCDHATDTPGCNFHNLQLNLVKKQFADVDNGLEYGGVKKNWTYGINAMTHANRYGRSGIEAILKARKVTSWFFSGTDATHITKEQRAKWKNAMAYTSNAPVSFLLDAIWVIESGLCYPGRDMGSGKKIASALANITEGFFTSKQQQSKLQSLLESAMEQSLKGKDSNPFMRSLSMADMPSPLRTAIRHLLPHLPGNPSSYALGDAGNTDPTSFLTAVKWLDSQTGMDRNKFQVSIFDTSVSPFEWNRGGTMDETNLYISATRALKKAGMECKSSTVESPNTIFGLPTKEDVPNAMFPYYHDKIKKGKAEGKHILYPEYWGKLWEQTNVPVVSNDYWGINGGFNMSYRWNNLIMMHWDKWFLDLLPSDYVDELMAAQWPQMNVKRWEGMLDSIVSGKFVHEGLQADMLDVPYFDGFALRVAGELRMFFYLCEQFYKFDETSLTTPECVPGGKAWENPKSFMLEIKKYVDGLVKEVGPLNPWSGEWSSYLSGVYF